MRNRIAGLQKSYDLELENRIDSTGAQTASLGCVGRLCIDIQARRRICTFEHAVSILCSDHESGKWEFHFAKLVRAMRLLRIG